MKALIGVIFFGLLVAGCSDSSTQSTVDDQSTSQPDSETASTEGPTSEDSGAGGTVSGEDDSSAESPTEGGGADNGSSDTTEAETAPSVVKFTGSDFGYPRINTTQYPQDDPDYFQYTLDERVSYTVWAPNYLEAHSLLEAMHAINDYREDFQQIKFINGGSETLDSLIGDYCPTSGPRFAADRCEFYARLAYSKTMAQDGWQIEHRQNNNVPLMCGGVASKFYDCSYSVMGHSRAAGSGYDGPNIGEISTLAVSPIEAWQYERNEPKITAINRAARRYVECSMGDQLWYTSGYFQLRPTLSPWDIQENTDQIESTQYGVLAVWLISDDTVEDVFIDVTAEHDASNSCKEVFRSDLINIQPNARL